MFFSNPPPFGSVSCFVVGICLSNYNLYSFLIHQASYSKRLPVIPYTLGRFGKHLKTGRYPITVLEVLVDMIGFQLELRQFVYQTLETF